jgi:hypothetical protein
VIANGLGPRRLLRRVSTVGRPDDRDIPIDVDGGAETALK